MHKPQHSATNCRSNSFTCIVHVLHSTMIIREYMSLLNAKQFIQLLVYKITVIKLMQYKPTTAIMGQTPNTHTHRVKKFSFP